MMMECGCGKELEEFDKYGRLHKYINGHQNIGRPSLIKGIPKSEEHKRKVSNTLRGKAISKETKKRMSNRVRSGPWRNYDTIINNNFYNFSLSWI
jgi:hypothetical protein